MKKTMTRALSLLLACILVLGLGLFSNAASSTLPGDIDNDGELTIFDALRIVKAVLNDTPLENSDVNGDGKTSLADVIRVLRLIATGEAPEVGDKENTSADINVENGVVKDAVSINGDKVSAAVPEGVAVDEGATSLTLSVTAMDNTNGNVTTGATEDVVSYDVHIEGVAASNTVAIIVDLGAILPIGQNTGTVSLYHIENGVANAMAQVMSLSELDVHNEFYYYPATGNVYVALATFSEIALVNDTENVWDGTADHEWYDADKTELVIANANQLHSFAQIVGGMADGIDRDAFAGKKVTLVSDIDLGDSEANNRDVIFYPIGYYYNGDSSAPSSTVYSFEGTFDGAGHTISNFYQNTWEIKGDYDANYYKDAMGLFGYVVNGRVENLTVDNFSSDGEFTPTGVIAAYAVNSEFENIAITNCNPRVYNTGNGGIVGIGGNGDDTADKKLTLTNITVDNTNKISALWGSWDVACGGIMGMFRGNGLVEFTNCHIAAQIDVYNDVCANYQYYWYRYSGMLIGSVRKNTTENGYTVADTTGITAESCTATIGDWADYYYCEFQKNSPASYSEDYQFSRVPESEIEFDADGNVLGCTHTHTETEDKQAVFIPFNQILQGNGYGVKATETFDGVEVIRLDAGKVKVSTEKFTAKAVTEVNVGEEIAVTDLFEVIPEYENYIHDTAVTLGVTSLIDGETVEYTYKADPTKWEYNTITFENTGRVRITIQDYFYCTPTVIEVNVIEETQPVEKFTANVVDAQDSYTQITLGELFSAENVAETVEATVTDPNGNATTIEATADDWASKTVDLVKDGEWSVTIKEATASFTVNKVDKFKKLFDRDFLYRAGNKNAISLSSLFEEIETEIGVSSVNVEFESIEGNVEGAFTSADVWTNGSIQFTGTGVVAVKISADGANEVVLNLEVVDAKNATTAQSATSSNIVLLNNISGTFTVNGGNTLYGNGFTVTLPTTHTTSWTSGVTGYIHIDNGNLDNVQIIGPVYPETYIYREQAGNETNGCEYFKNSVLINAGDCTITNSYISGSRAAIYVKGGNNIVIENTTVSGGSYANIEVSVANSLVLRDLTTEQKEVENSYNVKDSNGNIKKIIGLGVAIGSENTEVYIEGTLNQFNWINEAQWDAMLGNYASQFPDLFGDSSYSSYWHYREGDTTTKYVNLSLIFACDWNENKLHDDRSDKSVTYTPAEITVATKNGGVYSVTGAGELTDGLLDMPVYAATSQYPVAPLSSFDFTNKNYVAMTDGSNEFCYRSDDGTVMISFDEGASKVWDSDILTASKNGFELNCSSVSLDGAAIDVGSSITFTESGTHTVEYVIVDPYNYKLDSDGNVAAYEKEYKYSVSISVTAVPPSATPAVFKFGTSGTATERIQVGNAIYLSATGIDASALTSSASATYATSASAAGTQTIMYSSDKTWASVTMDGNTYYFPVVEMTTTDSKFSHTGSWYGCFPVFEGAVSIEDAGITYDGSTTEKPSSLAAINPQPTFRHQGTVSKVPTEPSIMTKGTSNGKLCYTTQTDLSSSNERNEEWILAKYTYIDNTSTTYYWFIAYHCQASTNGLCVTPDTLVTLADGSQKRVDEISYNDELLAWNFFEGEYVATPASIIFVHDTDNYDILALEFEDGTVVKTINAHGFFDVSQNDFVMINENNVAEYIGHEFVKADSGNRTAVKLTGYSVYTEETEVYSIQTAKYINFMVENMFSITPPPFDGWFDYFEIGEGMKYDEEKMNADIEKYGLYEYDDFAEYVTYEQFIAFNGPYLKVLVGRGVLTYDDILRLISTYVNPNS